MDRSKVAAALRTLTGKRVEQLRFDYSVTLVFDADAEIRISSPFEVLDAAGEALPVDPEALTIEAVALIMSALHKDVCSVFITDGAVLRIELAGGLVVRALPSERYEAWSFGLPDGSQLMSYPGGEIA